MVWVAFRVFFGVMPLIAFASGIFWVGRGYGRLTPLGVAATVGAAICVPFAAVRLVAILGGVGIPQWLEVAGFGGGLIVSAWFLLLTLTRLLLINVRRLNVH